MSNIETNNENLVITRKNATYPLDPKVSWYLKLIVCLPPIFLAAALTGIKMTANNVLNIAVTHLGAPAFYSIAAIILNLCSTICTPIGGKMGDIIGRKKFSMTVLIAFSLGIAGCGFASNLTIFVSFYTFMCLAYGLLNALTNSMIADVLHGADRTRYMGFLASVSGFAAIATPIISGFAADRLGVSKMFYFLVPLALIAWLLILLLFPDIKHNNKKVKIDFLGMLTFPLVVAPFTIALTMGGKQIPWSSPLIIVMFAVSIIALFAFIQIEKKAAEPIMGVKMFQVKGFTVLIMVMLLSSALTAITGSYLIMYCQRILHFSAAQTGTFTSPRLISMFLAPVMGQYIGKRKNYKQVFTIGSTIFAIAAIGFLFLLNTNTTYVTIMGLLVVLNLAPLFDQVPSMALAAYIMPKEMRGIGIGTLMCAMAVCSTVVTAVCGLILNNVAGGIVVSIKYMLIMSTVMLIIRLVLIILKMENPVSEEA